MTNKNHPKGCICVNGFVYTPFITVKGKRISKANGVFKFRCTRCGA
jgi:hypothetical protein